MSIASQAGPSGIGQVRRTKNRWTTNKLEHLVRVWSYYYTDLQEKRDHPVPVYRRIVDEMMRKGYTATLEEVRGRIHNLGTKFRKEAALSHGSGRPSSWPLFYQIEKFMNYEVPAMEAQPKLRTLTYSISNGEALSTEPQYLDEERLEEDDDSQKELQEDKAMEVEPPEVEGLEEERLDEERLEEERLDEERLDEERLEEEHLEEERLEEERLEEERLDEERFGEERLDEERLEEERLDDEGLEEERLDEECSEGGRLEEERITEERLRDEESDQSQDKDIRRSQPSSPQRPLLKELREEIQQKQNKLQQQAKARQQQLKLPQQPLVHVEQHPRPANKQPQQTSQQHQQPMRPQQQELRPKQEPQQVVRQPMLSTTQRHSTQQRQEQKQHHPQEQQQQQRQEQKLHHRQEQEQQQQRPQPKQLRGQEQQQQRQEQQQQRQEQKQHHRQEQEKQQQRQEQKQQHRQEQQQQREEQKHQKHRQEQKQLQQLREQQRSHHQKRRKLRRVQQKQHKVTTDDDTYGEETPSPPPTPPPPPLRTLKDKAIQRRTESKERSREPRQRLLQIKSNHRLETIDDYYAKLYCNNMLADVTLVLWHEGEMVTLPAHRVILCNHSPYFASIFEKVSPIVGLGAVVMILPTDVPLKVMELLLQFIYSGETSIPASMIDDVWRCAVQLKIRGFWSESRGESNEPLVNRPEQEQDGELPSAVQMKDQSDRSRNGGTKRARSRLEPMEESNGQARKRARWHQPSPSDEDEFDNIELTEVSSEVGFDLLRSDLDEDEDDAEEEEEYANDDDGHDEEDETDEGEDEDDDENVDDDKDTDEGEDEDENEEANEEDENQATGEEEDEARSIDELGHFKDDDDDDEEDEEEEDSEESEEEDSDGDDEDEYEIGLGEDNNDVEEDEAGQSVRSEDHQGDEDEQEPMEEGAERSIAIEQPPDTPETVQDSVDARHPSCVEHEADLTPPPSFPNSPQEVGCETRLEINGYESNDVAGDVGRQSNGAASVLPPVVVTRVQPSSPRVRIDSSKLQVTQKRIGGAPAPSATRGPLAVYRRRQYRSFTCKLCTSQFSMADNWLKHVEKTHARDTRKLNRIAFQLQDKTSKSYCCDLCQKCLTSEFDWVQHVICQHTELYPHYFAESFGTPTE